MALVVPRCAMWEEGDIAVELGFEFILGSVYVSRPLITRVTICYTWPTPYDTKFICILDSPLNSSLRSLYRYDVARYSPEHYSSVSADPR